MVTHDGELTETPVLAIRHWCDDCRDMVIEADWAGLLSARQG